MELIYGIHNLREKHRSCVATIGAFDGIHLGHRALLDQVTAYAKKMNLPSTVIVFEPLPREYFAPKQSPARLTSFRERHMQLLSCGVDRVLLIHFTQAVSQMSALEFIQRVFVDGLGVRQIVVGDDLRFGHDRQGDFGLLRDVGALNGFGVSQSDTFLLEGERVSSTRIRKLLEQSDFTTAERLLGRPYTICGKVVVGRQLGRTLGAPTANLELHRLKTALSGVYAVNVMLASGKVMQGVANVGTRPTVDDSIKAILEVHVLDFSGDLYGSLLEVTFLEKIRDEQRFANLDELKTQIHQDIAWVHNFFNVAVS
ncbi:MAG: bifunctional riboflavin kinase/FAD synthetase [Pseudomonadota bacterium]